MRLLWFARFVLVLIWTHCSARNSQMYKKLSQTIAAENQMNPAGAGVGVKRLVNGYEVAYVSRSALMKLFDNVEQSLNARINGQKKTVRYNADIGSNKFSKDLIWNVQ